jgi:hypothetical protein
VSIVRAWNTVHENLLLAGPKCDSVIDHVNPWRVLVFDRTLQSIAYKLVPHLYKGSSETRLSLSHSVTVLLLSEEIERQIAYYKERDLPYPSSLVGKWRNSSRKINILFCEEKLQEKRDEEEQQQLIPANSDLHIYDDQVAICMETKAKDLQVNGRVFRPIGRCHPCLISSHWHVNLLSARATQRSHT